MATLFLLCSLAVTGFCSFCKAIGRGIGSIFQTFKSNNKPKRVADKPTAPTQEERHDLLDFDEFCDMMDEGDKE